MLEDAARADVGSIGSNNILTWRLKGCVGVVTSATARDTDEVAAQKVPLYFRRPGRGIRPGRNEVESVNRPVACGGVLVVPGDVVVADGDGVAVMPRARAGEVARYARKAWTRKGRAAQTVPEARPTPGRVGQVGRAIRAPGVRLAFHNTPGRSRPRGGIARRSSPAVPAAAAVWP